jgi:hypothetical protein
MVACTPETTADDPRVSGLIVLPQVEPNMSILLDQRTLGGRSAPRPTPAEETPATTPATVPATSPSTAPETAPATTPA